MRRALELAHEAAEQGEVPVGAIVVHQDRIIGEGYNLRESEADPTAHAEIVAMRRAAKHLGFWRLVDCTLVVTLEPCPMCAGAMVNARLAHVIYGCADPKMGCVDTLHQLCTEPRFNHRMTTTSGVLAEPCAAILQQFFRARR